MFNIIYFLEQFYIYGKIEKIVQEVSIGSVLSIPYY